MFIKPYPNLACPSGDGRNFVLLEPLVYVTTDPATNAMVWYRGIVGAETDGASTPRGIWNAFPPFGPYWLPAVLHDCAYRGKLETSTDGKEWRRVELSKDACDSLLLDAMVAAGVDVAARDIIYEAVKKYGYTSYGQDAAMPITT